MDFQNVDKENSRKSLVITIVLHSVFLICAGMSFFSCWTMPDPLNVVGEVTVTFGKTETGTGENTEPAENPVVDPAQQEEQVEPTAEEDIEPIAEPVVQQQPAEVVTPTHNDSDSRQVLNPVKNKPVEEVEPIKDPVTDNNPTPKPVNNTPQVTTPTNTTMPGTTMGNDGGGTTHEAGVEGDPTGTMDASSTGKGKSSGNGDGPNINGWKFASEPSAPAINTVGVAHIEFKINSFGKVLTAKVVGGAFSTAEKEKIKAEFMKIKLQKLSTNTGGQSTYSGTYDWKLEY